jgi:dUTP pyrophosphatase
MSDVLNFKKFKADAIIPTRNNKDDAGLDLYSNVDVVLAPGEGKAIDTAVGVALPHAVVGMICDRSSMAKKGLKVAGGIIDTGYRGTLMVVLWNMSTQEQKINKNDKIAQLLTIPILLSTPTETSELSETERGTKGFGSSGA